MNNLQGRSIKDVVNNITARRLTREHVVWLLVICMGINFFSITFYVFGYYRNMSGAGFFYDLLLGAESAVSLASDVILFNVLQVPADTALAGPTPEKVVDTLRKFIMVNIGTIAVCCAGHLAAARYVSTNVRVEGAQDTDQAWALRNQSFLQMALLYIIIAAVKGFILYHIYLFYQECKINPPTRGPIFLLNPLVPFQQAVVVVQNAVPKSGPQPAQTCRPTQLPQSQPAPAAVLAS